MMRLVSLLPATRGIKMVVPRNSLGWETPVVCLDLRDAPTVLNAAAENAILALWQAAWAGMDGWDSTLMPA